MVVESGYLYVLYWKILQLTSSFPSAKEVLVKILSEEDILDGGMVFFDRRLEGLSKIYDFKHLYNRPINWTEEV